MTEIGKWLREMGPLPQYDYSPPPPAPALQHDWRTRHTSDIDLLRHIYVWSNPFLPELESPRQFPRELPPSPAVTAAMESMLAYIREADGAVIMPREWHEQSVEYQRQLAAVRAAAAEFIATHDQYGQPLPPNERRLPPEYAKQLDGVLTEWQKAMVKEASNPYGYYKEEPTWTPSERTPQ